MEHMKPAETLEATINIGVGKSKNSLKNLLILGVLAGAFIAFGAEGSNMAAFNLLCNPASYGLGRILSGAIFPVGLMMVILAGAELFTGNVLMIAGVCDGRIAVADMLRNWIVVYIGNLIGALLVAWLMSQTGLLDSGGGMLGAVTLKIGVGKTNLSFGSAFVLGIFCNWLVCIAVWLAFGAKTTVGKMLGVFFPIWLFVTSGFEHSVANMYYIPAAIWAKTNDTYIQLSGVANDALANLTWGGFFINNLIPVTIGNIVGGGLFVAIIYWVVYKKA